jgi:hypothetical protein
MSYPFVQDRAATRRDYQQAAAALGEPAPSGLTGLAVAFACRSGLSNISVWERELAWQRFRTERLVHAKASLGGRARPEPPFRDLPSHLVQDGRGSGESLDSRAQEIKR